MAEMNNSVYGNPSSLTIHNEKNIKAGKTISWIVRIIIRANMIEILIRKGNNEILKERVLFSRLYKNNNFTEPYLLLMYKTKRVSFFQNI